MPAFAQTAQITGLVTDQSGAVIPDTNVIVTNTGIGIKRKTATNGDGFYSVPLLQPGAYQITVQKDGFKTLTQMGITLQLEQTARFDFTLTTGQVAEAVNITDEAPLLQTDSTTLSTSISGKLVQDLPLSGRNYIQLVQLVPGVTSGPPNGLATGRSGCCGSGKAIAASPRALSPARSPR